MQVFGRCRKMRKKTDRILDWIYPRRCPVCDGILEKDEPYICRTCAPELEPLKEPRCRKCGVPIRSLTEEYCVHCAGETHSFDRGFAVYPYHGPIGESLMRFKYSGRQEYAGFYAQAIAVCGGREIRRMRPEILIPVPLHRKKLQTRGYNQAEVLARRLSEKTGIPVETDLVVRRKRTLPQKELNRRQRKKNLKDAFAMKRECRPFPWKRVLLVDDIYTTGSTVDALALLLKRNGAAEVFFVAVAAGGTAE